jgi:SNW domain-containing protein 1
VALKSSLAAYSSDDDSGNGSEASYSSAEDEDARKIRDQMRNNSHASRTATSQKRLLLDWQNQPNHKNQCSTHVCLIKNHYLVTLQTTMLIVTSMTVFCFMVRSTSMASAAIYKARGNIPEGNGDSFGGGAALDNDWFNLGQARVGFEGAADQEIKEGPVQFEKYTGDVFSLNQFLDEA